MRDTRDYSGRIGLGDIYPTSRGFRTGKFDAYLTKGFNEAVAAEVKDPGGRVLVNICTEAQIAKRRNQKAVGWLEYVSAKEVREFEASTAPAKQPEPKGSTIGL